MRKIVLLTLGFLAQWLNLSSASAQPASTNSLLWKVSGKNLNTPSYVFGTIHSICQEDYFFTDKMKKAFEETKKLILEINLADPNLQSQYQQQLMLPEGQELKQYFDSEEEYQTFAKNTKDLLGIDISFFSHFKPFMLISMISMKSISCPNPSSYEMNLMTMAKQQHAEVDGLETTLSQLEIFDQMSKSDIKNMLLESVQQLNNGTQEFEQLVSHYKSQDIDALYKQITASPEFKGHEEKLLSGRNIQWMNKLMFEMNHQSCFIAVGAGHLSGEKGVLNLLRQSGYTIEAVN